MPLCVGRHFCGDRVGRLPHVHERGVSLSIPEQVLIFAYKRRSERRFLSSHNQRERHRSWLQAQNGLLS